MCVQENSIWFNCPLTKTHCWKLVEVCLIIFICGKNEFSKTLQVPFKQPETFYRHAKNTTVDIQHFKVMNFLLVLYWELYNLTIKTFMIMESSPISSKFNSKKIAGSIGNPRKAAKFCKMDLIHFFCKCKMKLKFLI